MPRPCPISFGQQSATHQGGRNCHTAPNEESRVDEPGHAALYWRVLSGNRRIGWENLTYLISPLVASPSKPLQKKPAKMEWPMPLLVFFRLLLQRKETRFGAAWDPTREQLIGAFFRKLTTKIISGIQYCQSVPFSFGLTKDDTGKVIDRFVERIEANSGQLCNDDPGSPCGTWSLWPSFLHFYQASTAITQMFIWRTVASKLRTFAEKYLRMLPDMTRQDGLGWNYGRSVGAYGQLHCISLILQAMRDQWIAPEKISLYLDTLRRLFQYFFVTYIDQEKGDLVIRDDERNTVPNHTTRMANFDAARYLCQWSRLAKVIGGSSVFLPQTDPRLRGGLLFSTNHKEEHGLFLYRDENLGVQYQLPVIGPSRYPVTISPSPLIQEFWLAVNKYLPVMLPELTFGDVVTVPSYYGKSALRE